MAATFALLLLFAAAAPEPFGKQVAIAGRTVHLHCEGAGSPVVILLHGTPRFSFHFALVWPGVASKTKVCVYDRAGDAWSEPVPGQPTAKIFIDELDAVARHLSPSSPVILAGHSVGGVLARAYYAAHPERVAAMVLIDTAPLLPQFVDATDEQLRALAARPRPPAPPKTVIAPPFDRLPERFHAAHLWATDKWQEYASGVDMFQALRYQADLYQLAARADATRIPVWFLSRAATPDGNDAWGETQRKLAAQWSKSKLVRVAPSGHDIQLDQPGAVTQAILEAIDASARPQSQ